ncbi:MAG: diguanylate cyclase [Pygmaiobacter massiliensis]|nr:diguanylate cyclase [Pygmaiobacter massiliensis]
MSLNERFFILVPLVASLCNVFLFLTCLSAKKDRVVASFMQLLLVFMAWCGGSLFMRLELFPSDLFWYETSIMGIFLVPFFVYNFVYCFCETKGSFVRTSLFVSWVVVTLMNLGHVFIKTPHVLWVDGEKRFEFSVSFTIIFPIALALLTLGIAWRIALTAVREDRVSLADLRPLTFGVIIMLVGTLLDVFPFFVSLPNDTFACGLNALFLYYSLYRRRILSLTHIASNSSSYLLAAIFTTIILIASYSSLNSLYSVYFSDFMAYKTIVIAVFFSVMTMAVYTLTRRLMNNLFTKRREVLDASLKQFSLAVSKVLEMQPLLQLYREFLQENFPKKVAYICVHDPSIRRYRIVCCTREMVDCSFSLADNHPLVKWLSAHKRGISYSEFAHTQTYKSMWEEEKDALIKLAAEYIQPLCCDDQLVGITLFSFAEHENEKFSFAELGLLDSAAAILSIALKNSFLYTEMQQEARLDALTGLYNRGYFSDCIHQQFELARHDTSTLVMISLDNFRLYNELYGIREGDAALRQTADNLRAVIGNRGVIARYSGKELAVFLPFCDAITAQQLMQQLSQLPSLPPRDDHRYLTHTAGICSYPAGASSLEEMFTYASMAVYSGKTNGKGRVVIYSPEMGRAAGSTVSKRALAESCASTVYALTAAIDAKDHYTFNHSQNVSEYAAALAAAIPLDSEHVEIVRQAGLLHDIGKIGIPESILSKTSRLTDDEMEIMRSHPEGAIAMIRHLPSMNYVIPSVIGHHERWDGHGYPRQLAGEMIPVGARCLCLADSFDAMTSRRSYKEALSVEQALAEIRRNLGTQFDPQLGLLFIRLVEEGTIKVRPAGFTPQPNS